MKRFLLAFTVVAFAATARADEVSDLILNKAIEAHGGEAALRKAKAGEYSMTGEMSVLGADLKFKGHVAYMLPDKYSMTIETELMGMELKIAQTVNGEKVKTTLNKMAQKVGDAESAELKAALAMQEMSFLYPLLDAKKYTVKAEKEAKVGDADAKVLSATPTGGKEIKIYFDAKTNLMVKLSRKGMAPGGGGEVDEESFFTDYKKVDGLQTPMTVKVLHNGEPFMKAKVTDVKYADKLDAKKFTLDD